jgi:hypoxanthine-DNA glycosylase
MTKLTLPGKKWHKTQSVVPPVRCFNPIASIEAKVLVLGSAPGVRSLKESEYYAHPQNSFWYIMGCLFNFSSDSNYSERCRNLMLNKVALWDVLKSCEREGSLDASINSRSIIANDFDGFLRSYSDITSIFFNGTKAETVFRKYVSVSTQQRFPEGALQRLPSTSPAYAAMDRNSKLQKWSLIKSILNK